MHLFAHNNLKNSSMTFKAFNNLTIKCCMCVCGSFQLDTLPMLVTLLNVSQTPLSTVVQSKTRRLFSCIYLDF